MAAECLDVVRRIQDHREVPLFLLFRVRISQQIRLDPATGYLEVEYKVTVRDCRPVGKFYARRGSTGTVFVDGMACSSLLSALGASSSGGMT